MPQTHADRLANLARGRATRAANLAAARARTAATVSPATDDPTPPTHPDPVPGPKTKVQRLSQKDRFSGQNAGHDAAEMLDAVPVVENGKNVENPVPDTADVPRRTPPVVDDDAAQARAKGPRYVRAKLYPKQEACFFGAERWSLTEATTKGGKTSGAIVWLAEQAILGKAGQNFWWVAPVFPQAEVAYRRMARAFPYDLRATHDSKMRITLANGTAIWFKSGETPDNLFGEDVYAAVVDEASRLREESWHALRSTLTATKGPARMIGNVKGRRNWFYAMCRKAEGGEQNMAYHKLTWRDAVEAGVINAEEVEDARRVLPPMVFQELYEADAADDSGNPFGMEAIAECVAKVGGLQSTDPVTCWAWDLGKRQDWTCGVGLDRLQRVAAVERFQMPWREAKERIIAKTNRLPALVDSTGVGDAILEDLQASGPNFEGFYFTGKSKQSLMEHLRSEIQGRRIGIPDGVIRMELEQFEYEYTRTAVTYSAPSGAHDDAVIALALAARHWQANGSGAFHFARSEKLERSSYERGGRERAILI